MTTGPAGTERHDLRILPRPLTDGVSLRLPFVVAAPQKAGFRALRSLARFGKRIHKCRTSCICARTSILVSAPRNAETTRGDTGKERVDGAERPSTLVQVWSIRLTVASIPQSVNEVSVDPLRGTTPPPWSRIATLTRLLEPSAPASRFGYGCGGAVGRQLDHRRAQVLAHLRP